MSRRIASAAVVAFAGLVPARAAGPSSLYTDVSGTTCHDRGGVQEGGVILSCPALPGYRVTVSDNGNINQVTIGSKAGTAAAFQAQSLGGKLEWRIKPGGSRPAPYAAIIRLIILDGADTIGQALGVAKVTPGGSCVVGFVDVHANPDANAMARRAADEQAPSFDCAHARPKAIGPMAQALAERLPLP